MSDGLEVELRDIAVRAAEAAAELAVSMRVDGFRIGTKSTTTDYVTEVDERCEALIVDALIAARPADTLIGEEGANRVGTTGVEWHIDPIDGTTNFVYGHPGWAVSIAAVRDGRPIAGAVVDPSHGETFAAATGHGATKNGRPIEPSGRDELDRALVATGFSYRPARRARQAAVVSGLLPEIGDIRRMGSAATDLCSVACGRVDAYYEAGLNSWDMAAGVVICVEAGAVVDGLRRARPSLEFVVATAPGIAASLRDRLRELDADDVVA